MQQLYDRQLWQTNAEKLLGELKEMKAAMALQQSLLENLTGELKAIVPELVKRTQKEDHHMIEFTQQALVMLARLEGNLRTIALERERESPQFLDRIERAQTELSNRVKLSLDEHSRKVDLLRLNIERSVCSPRTNKERGKGSMEVESHADLDIFSWECVKACDHLEQPKKDDSSNDYIQKVRNKVIVARKRKRCSTKEDLV